MLAKIEEPLALLEPPPLNVTLTYTSTERPGAQFTWDTETREPIVFISQPGTIIEVTLKNAVFSKIQPIVFFSNQAILAPSAPFDDGHRISITVNTLPQHYLHPLAISFNIDFESVSGINSPQLFIVLPPSPTDIDLHYSINGGFVLDGMIDLANLEVLINTIRPFDLTFDLSSDNPVALGVSFDPTTPLIGPSWLTPNLTSPTKLQVRIPETPGRFGSFQFVINVQTLTGTVQVTSPDPILINATIGDG